jgi:hypothetical protein
MESIDVDALTSLSDFDMPDDILCPLISISIGKRCRNGNNMGGILLQMFYATSNLRLFFD